MEIMFSANSITKINMIDVADKKKYTFIWKKLFLSCGFVKAPNFGKKYILAEDIIKVSIALINVPHKINVVRASKPYALVIKFWMTKNADATSNGTMLRVMEIGKLEKKPAWLLNCIGHLAGKFLIRKNPRISAEKKPLESAKNEIAK